MARLGHLGEQGGGAEPGLRGADGGCLRVGVDDVRHGLVVGLAGLAENVRGDDLALVLADVGQQPHAGDVADGPQAFPGAQVRVDPDAVRAGVGADRFQAARYARAPAGGDEQVVAAQLAAVLEGQHVVRRRRAARRSPARRG